MNNKISDY